MYEIWERLRKIYEMERENDAGEDWRQHGVGMRWWNEVGELL